MKIPLNQFEQYIDETILQRGLSYFKNGYVNQPEEITSGLYEAIVEGTEDYTVRLQIKNGIVTEYSCNCPYDFGPVCKHVAAVIFYLQQEKLELQQNTAKKKKLSRKTSKRKTIAEQVDELLSQLSHDELKQFIQEQAGNDPSFRRSLLSVFAHLNKNESQALYTQQVKTILRTAAGRDNFIDWQAVRYVGKAVYDLLVTAQKHYENGNYQSAILISCAVLEEMTEAMQFADDSNADIGGNIDVAYNLLVDIASGELPEETRKKLFNYALEAYNKNIYLDWDWHLGMLQLASMIFRNEHEARQIMALLDKAKHSEYEHEEAQAIKLQILKKTKGEKEAERFMEQNLSNPSLRTEAIRNAISKKDYEKAITIAHDGIKHDSKNKPGLVMDWYDWLLRIAIAKTDTEKIIEYSRLLFVDSIREKQEYYHIMKTHVDQDKWDFFVEGLVSDIIKKNRWLDFHVIADIYINEEWWNRLLELLKNNASMEYVKHYEKYLAKDYPNELADLYEQSIIEYMNNKTGRNYYQNACRYIRRMIKLGARQKANKVIEKLRTDYPQRRALLEELEHI